MTTGPSSRADFRARVHAMLRTTILDSARRLAIERDWADVRIADIAEEVGVSRQTIYNEYGAKEALGMALFSREVDEQGARLVAGVANARDFRSAVHGTIQQALDMAREHPVVQRILKSASNGGSPYLLALLTTRADLIVVPMRTALAAAFLERFPGPDPERAELLTDLMIRATLSQVVLPSDLPEDRVVATIVDMVASVVSAPPDDQG